MDFMAVGMLDVKEPTEYAADAVSRIRAYLLGTKRPWFHRHRDHELFPPEEKEKTIAEE